MLHKYPSTHNFDNLICILSILQVQNEHRSSKKQTVVEKHLYISHYKSAIREAEKSVHISHTRAGLFIPGTSCLVYSTSSSLQHNAAAAAASC